MIKKVIKYEDFDGNVREEEFYFGLTKAELTTLQLSYDGGLEKALNRIINANDTMKLMEIFKNIIYWSYGEKSADGKRMIKTEEVKVAFTQTQAYSDLFMELATDTEAALKFVMGIMPKDVNIDEKEIRKQIDEQNAKLAPVK